MTLLDARLLPPHHRARYESDVALQRRVAYLVRLGSKPNGKLRSAADVLALVVRLVDSTDAAQAENSRQGRRLRVARRTGVLR